MNKPVNRWDPVKSLPLQLDSDAEIELNAASLQGTIALGLAARIQKD